MSYVEEMFGLSDVRAVVTGGAGVLPKGMAITLARAGASVSIWGRGSSHPVQEAVNEVQEAVAQTDSGSASSSQGPVIAGETVDTNDEAAVQRALESTVEAMGMPNLLVNGVGGNKGKSDFVDIDTKLFSEVLEMNLLAGLIIPTKVFTRRWIADGVRGSIINVASMTSYVPLSGVWAYTAAKSAVLKLTEGAANEFAPHGIRVNAVAPGFFIGHQNRKLLIANDETGELTARGQAIIDRTPFGRFGVPEDLDGTTLFLASPRASGFLTGVCIPVDGGYLVDNI
jgi:NAD(P)-dependent dehydrogenase (short-subunit alcohol dehydrogenase family)